MNRNPNPLNAGRGAALAMLLITATLLLPIATAHDGEPCGDECFQPGAADAQIIGYGNGQTTFQAAGNTVPVGTGQSAIFSLDGGFWVDVEYKCIEAYVLEVFINGEKTQEEWRYPECGSGIDHIWVDMGLEAGEVTLVLSWWGCNGERGFGEGSSFAGDPPLFDDQGNLRAIPA